MSEGLPPEDEQAAQELADELKRLRVEDVLVSTLMHVSSIGYRRLGAAPETADDRDLEQVRLAIETMQALTPVLGRFVPEELVRDFNSSVANLQLAYAKVASEGGASEETASGRQSPDEEPTDETGHGSAES